jgi:hypothetical protein
VFAWKLLVVKRVDIEVENVEIAVIILDKPYDTTVLRVEIPGLANPPSDDNPYDKIVLNDDIPGFILKLERPYDTIEDREDIPEAPELLPTDPCRDESP